MTDLLGRRMVLAVAQRPFEAQSFDGGPLNLFCTLEPLFFLPGGRPADAHDFPNNGLVWWMLRPDVRQLAEPGRLVTGILELAQRYDEHNQEKTFYQVQKDSLEGVHEDDCIELISAPDGLGALRDLLNVADVIVLGHPPASKCLVRWRGSLYGPFDTTSSEKELGRHVVTLRVSGPTSQVLRFGEEQLVALQAGQLVHVAARVALDQRNRVRSNMIHSCDYALLLADGWAVLQQTPKEVVPLESDTELLRRLSRQLLTRKRRQEFVKLLDELHTHLDGLPPQEADVLAGVRRLALRQDSEVQSLANAMLSSGIIDAQLALAAESRFQQYLSENAARVEAEIRSRIDDSARQLEALDRALGQQQQELDARARQARERLENELGAIRRRDEEFRSQREAELLARAQDIDRQRETLKANLESVAQRFETARADVVNDFLALVPLLQKVSLLPDTRGDAGEVGNRVPPATETQPGGDAPLDFPAFVSDLSSDGAPAPTETEFFERFRALVRARGFAYRPIELVAFHLSVKTGDLTILGGASGTGKSSLPRMYAEALDGRSSPARRYLELAVSPSWLDLRDVLGHVNALERRYQPAESGLYPQLIFAAEEFQRKQGASGLYFVTLDEMNLAHVEHYFSAFLQALERPSGQRAVRCFDERSIAQGTAFGPWHTLYLPDSLRFVGTVNFDETTKQLSLRLLDRANLVILRPRAGDIAMAGDSPGHAAASGAEVTLATLRTWRRQALLEDATSAALLDQLRPQLQLLGCPLNPRRYRAIQEFLASAPRELCTPAQALDLQIAQRLLPQVRGLFRAEAQEALRQVRRLLEQHPEDLAESLQLIGEIEGREFGMDSGIEE